MKSWARRGAAIAAIALVMLSMANRALAAVPVIDSLGPQPVTPGGTLNVKAHGFTPSSTTVKLIWDNDATTLLFSGSADAAGNLDVNIVIPPASADGVHDIGACEATFDCPPATITHAPVEVSAVPPRFTSATPQPVAPGATLTFAGDHFGSSHSIKLFWNHFAADLGTTSSDAGGAISGSITVPAGTASGTYELEACQPAGGSSSHCLGGDSTTGVALQSVTVLAPAVPLVTTTTLRRVVTTTSSTSSSTTSSSTTTTSTAVSTTIAELKPPSQVAAAPQPVKANGVLASYDPRRHARDTVNLLIAAFALLTVSLAGGGSLVGGGGATAAAAAGRKSGSVGSAKVKHYKQRWEGGAPGDGSRLWRLPGTVSIDRFSSQVPPRVAPASPLLARVLTDGSYIRSMFGSAWVALPLAGVALGLIAVLNVHGHALPPTQSLMIAICVLGVFDALAGFLAALVFAAAVVVSGGWAGPDAGRTLLGLAGIWFAAPLIASAARPLRRPPATSREERWDRVADFFIASLIAAWAVQKMVRGLPGLSGFDLPIVSRADMIALAVLTAMVLRMAVETLASNLFPRRLAEVQPERLPHPPVVQRVIAIAVRTAIFLFIAVAFIGVRWQLFVGVTLFLVPQILKVFEDRFPNFTGIHRGLPKGIVKTVLMLIVGAVYAGVVFHRHRAPADLIADAFVLLSLPGLLLSLLDLIGREGPVRDMRWVERFAGAGVLVLGVFLALR
jgi:hypothetical protein